MDGGPVRGGASRLPLIVKIALENGKNPSDTFSSLGVVGNVVGT